LELGLWVRKLAFRAKRNKSRMTPLKGITVSTDANRPAPERFLTLIRQQQRGRLKVYLGFAAGVGKTYEMLQEGQKLKRQGVDVVIGIVETHGRAETAAQIGDLEQVTRRRIEHRGVTLEEMDLEALLARHPTIALVDELAHTNAPGSRFAKRYQDVEELLRNGINVITALNIQHLESLYDMVEKYTGVKVKERVPDYILGMADQTVNVDLTAEDLQERLRSGKIYPAERIERALANFFTPDNLSRLREFALQEIAHLLDRRRQRDHNGEKTEVGSDRVMVCLSSRSPRADALLRKGARLADRLNVPWYAVYIETPSESLDRVDSATQRQIANNLALAQQLGAVPIPYKGRDVVSTIASFVREYGITHIVMGRTLRPWYRRWFGQSVLDRLLREIPNVDVVVVQNQ
jgi:two-component system sensor histidine kinase KdpD